MTATGKPWVTPSVTTIGRSTPAEGVLSFCKMFSPNGGGGVDAADSGCWISTCVTACMPHAES